MTRMRAPSHLPLFSTVFPMTSLHKNLISFSQETICIGSPTYFPFYLNIDQRKEWKQCLVNSVGQTQDFHSIQWHSVTIVVLNHWGKVQQGEKTKSNPSFPPFPTVNDCQSNCCEMGRQWAHLVGIVNTASWWKSYYRGRKLIMIHIGMICLLLSSIVESRQ